MKNNILMPIISLSLLISCNISHESSNGDKSKKDNNLTCNEIWTNHINTYGNIDSIMKIKSWSTIDEYYIDEKIIRQEMIIKPPNKYYEKVIYPNGEFIEKIYNDHKGIIKYGNEVSYMSDEQLFESEFISYVFPEVYNDSSLYILSENKEYKYHDKFYYNIKLKTKYFSRDYIIDKETFKLFRIIEGKRVIEIDSTISKHGMNIFHSMSVYEDNSSSYKKSVSIKVNEKVSDDIFEI